jgi:ribosomal protein RSM22 (predicted rRNA methylase)
VRQRAPDFQPRSLLDLGAGPGTATLAALAIWPSLTALTLVEPNPHMRALAETFIAGAGSGHALQVVPTDARKSATPPADLVILSYVLAEQSEPHVASLAHLAAQRALQTLVIIEPGRTAGFARIKIARTALTSDGGLAILAPCPHANACPLPAPDWCHFSVRLARSRDHRWLKAADAPFEDEPYSYLALTRTRNHVAAPARVLRRPVVTKADVTLQLCTTVGLRETRLSRRDKAGYKAAKAIDWGDTFDSATTTPPETSS